MQFGTSALSSSLLVQPVFWIWYISLHWGLFSTYFLLLYCSVLTLQQWVLALREPFHNRLHPIISLLLYLRTTSEPIDYKQAVNFILSCLKHYLFCFKLVGLPWWFHAHGLLGLTLIASPFLSLKGMLTSLTGQTCALSWKTAVCSPCPSELSQHRLFCFLNTGHNSLVLNISSTTKRGQK